MTQDDDASNQLRASDAEREAVVSRLGDAVAEGRLTLEEFSERMEKALGARTGGELVALTGDLPSGVVPARPPRAPRAKWQVSLVGDVTRRGRWKVPADLRVLTLVGDAVLDLTQAELVSRDATITVAGLVGDLKIVVPHAVNLDLGGFVLVGDRTEEAASSSAPAWADNLGPLLRIRLFALVGDVKVVRV